MNSISIDEDDISPTAKDAVRLKFNPSGMDRVAKLKMLAAAFITVCEDMPGRESSVAVTNMQSASMWAVLAATKGL